MPFTRDQLEDINQIISATTTKLLMDENFIRVVTDSVSQAVLEQLNKKIDVQNKTISELKAEVTSLKAAYEKGTEDLDKLEQYTRRNSIIIYGIPEKNNEDIIVNILDLFQNKLNATLSVENIDRAHRLGKRHDERNSARPVIVKFVSYRCRQLIFSKKKLLKGCKITIKENLTSPRAKLLRAATEKYSHRCVWSIDGIIYAKLNGSIKIIHSINDI
ncbi:hypothetical protein RI129_007751 [Pyrocoelia pectoralis]|uniref:Uncharacterized protein n=1 Tax=Pyrocoelia pectoralis TaxID=417401 RepID=A0AAN7VF19_9COLE